MVNEGLANEGLANEGSANESSANDGSANEGSIVNLRCAILSPTYTWTAKVVQAATHLLKHSLVQCGRRRLDEAKAILSCIEMEDIKPCQARVAKQRRAAGVLKGQADAARLERLPPVDAMKEAVRKAMLTLSRIAADHRGMSHISSANKSMARACVVACIFLNGFAGRSGEWSRLRTDTVETMLSNGDTYIKCKDYNTENDTGEVGKRESVRQRRDLSPQSGAVESSYLDHSARTQLTSMAGFVRFVLKKGGDGK